MTIETPSVNVQWVSVKDTLPVDMQHVLVWMCAQVAGPGFSGRGAYASAYYDRQSFCSDGHPLANVTHWAVIDGPSDTLEGHHVEPNGNKETYMKMELHKVRFADTLTSNGWVEDQYGVFRKTQNGREFRVKLLKYAVRISVRTLDSKEWVRVGGGYLSAVVYETNAVIVGGWRLGLVPPADV